MKNTKQSFISVAILTAIFQLLIVLPIATRSGLAATANTIEKLTIINTPTKIILKLKNTPTFKVIQLDQKEAIIALKDAVPDKKLKKRWSGLKAFKKINIEQLPNDTITISVNTQNKIKKIKPYWIKQKHLLVVQFIDGSTRKSSPNKVTRQTKSPEKKPSPSAKQELVQKKEPEKQPVAEPQPVATQAPISTSPYSGTMDDLLIELKKSPCIDKEKQLKESVKLCKRGKFRRARLILEQFFKQTAKDQTCMPDAKYLYAYSYFKSIDKSDENMYLSALDLFRETISYYSKSPLLPYGYAGIAKTFAILNNAAEAEGYFKILLDQYPQYKGTPEVLVEMGNLYLKKATEEEENPALGNRYFRHAIPFFEQVILKHSYSSLVSDAQIGLGHALFKTNQFKKAVDVLTSTIKTHPKKIFATPELLRNLGDAYYQLGKIDEARDALTRAYNYFPDNPANNIILTKIGQTYIDQHQADKAIPIFKLVMEKYPGTDGFLISAMRLAENTTDLKNKNEIFTMLLKDYPDHAMGKLAMLKFGELQSDQGNYMDSIKTLTDLLSTNPRGLKKDTVYALQNSIKALFKSYMDNGNYPNIIKRYAIDKRIISRFDDPELFYIIANAFYKGHLYSEASDLYQTAFSYYVPRKRPDDLPYLAGVSLMESGKQNEALKMLNLYTKKTKQKDYLADAHINIAHILSALSDKPSALDHLQTALNLSRSNDKKADILIDMAQINQDTNHLDQAVAQINKAISLYKSQEHLFNAYRKLGQLYMTEKNYASASDSFSKALTYTDPEDPHSDLRFLLAKSYQKGSKYDQATKTYKDIISIGDPFWQKMAEEELKELKLGNMLENS